MRKPSFYLFRFIPPLLIFTVIVSMTAQSVVNMSEFFFGDENSWYRKATGYAVVFISICPSIMTIVSLGITVLGDPGTLISSISKNREIGALNDEMIWSFPLCTKCGLPKPPRCHHCSTCDRCHLKMDHHCPAIGLCVALRNQRPFLVMLNWAKKALSMVFFVNITVSCLSSKRRLQTVVLGMACFILYIPVSMLYSDSFAHVKLNVTTIEDMYADDISRYDIGKVENIRQVFGTGAFNRYLPIRSKMTGFEWASHEYQSDRNLC